VVIRSLIKQVIAFSPNYLIDTFKSWISMEVRAVVVTMNVRNYVLRLLITVVVIMVHRYYGSAGGQSQGS